MIKARFLTMVGLLALVSATAPATSQPKVKRADFSAQLTVDADGRATVAEFTGATGALARAVQSQLAAMRFSPAHLNGVAITASAYVNGSIVLTPQANERYSIGLDDLSYAPEFRVAAPISYPREMAVAGKSGSVEVKLHIGSDGRAAFVRTVSATSPEFEREVRAAVPALRFKPQTIAGHPAEVDVDLPVWFDGNRSAAKPGFQCGWDEKRPRMEGNSGCLGMIEVVFSMVRR